MKTKLNTKEIILNAVKGFPKSMNELWEYFKKYNKKISKNNLKVNITRLIKDGLVLRIDNKIWYSYPIIQNREATLKELEGKSLEEVKDLVVAWKSYFGLVTNLQVVRNKLSLVV